MKNKFGGIVFSTHPNFIKEKESSENQQIVPNKQTLRVELDKRNGKPATLVTGFQGTDEALKELAKTLKMKCGAGGSQRDGEILIQGDFRAKMADFLQNMGFKIKRIGF
jgi:translation initiation factor 1